MPEHILRLGETIRRRVFSELHEHYRVDLLDDEYAVRLGGLMAVLESLLVSPLTLVEHDASFPRQL